MEILYYSFSLEYPRREGEKKRVVRNLRERERSGRDEGEVPNQR